MKPGIPRLFPSIASFGLRNYKAVVCAVLLLVIVSPFVLGGLRLETVTASLSSPDDSFSQIYNRNMQLFGEGSPLVIRLEYSETPIQTLNLFTDALAKDLRTWDDILCVEYKALDLYDPFLFTTMLRAALLNADPAILSEFMAKFSEEGLRSNLRKSRKRLIALDDPSLRQRVTEDILDIFSLFLPALESRLNSGGFSFEQGYFDSAKENARLIFIFPAKSAEDAPYSVRLISQIEDVQNELKSSIAGADSIRTSFAGKYAISGETMVEYRRNLFLITITASLAVFLLLLLVFRNIRALIIAFVPIMISLIAVFMIARFFFNPINYLSMAFAAIIIGIGVDVMLHCTGRFFQLREKKMNLETALHSTLLDCGPPVVIGLTTTSAAFFCLVFADYQALRQFGLLTSSGLLVTLWICLILFPVMVKLLGSDSHKGIRLSRVHGLFASIFSYLLSRPVKSICIALVLFAFSLFHMQKFSFDMDLFSGLPDDLESMRIDESISETFGVSHLLATQLTLESEDYRSALKAQELLDRELSILVKENAVSGFQSPSQYLAYSDVTDNINVTWQSNSKRLKGHKDLFLKLLSDLKFTPNPWYGEYYELMERVLDLKNESVDIRILAVRSHPVFKKFFALDDKKLILQTYIWPVHDFSDYTVIKDIAARFSDLSMPEEVSLHTTGTYQMFTHISSVVRSDFFRVSLISSIAVILFVLIFYRNSMLVCICVAPVAVAIPLTLALFVLAKVSFTPMSVTYIAIIVGIGIDDAVHIISRARNRSTAEFRAILPEIGILITLTTLSTVIGFGSMMISSFYTIFSSGLVISLGVFFCLVFTILVVPAGCILLQRKLNN